MCQNVCTGNTASTQHEAMTSAIQSPMGNNGKGPIPKGRVPPSHSGSFCIAKCHRLPKVGVGRPRHWDTMCVGTASGRGVDECGIGTRCVGVRHWADGGGVWYFGSYLCCCLRFVHLSESVPLSARTAPLPEGASTRSFCLIKAASPDLQTALYSRGGVYRLASFSAPPSPLPPPLIVSAGL